MLIVKRYSQIGDYPFLNNPLNFGEKEMPLKRLRYTFDYCKANPLGFLIILALLGVEGFNNRVVRSIEIKYQLPLIILSLISALLIYGYGLVITKDTIRGGEKLPKIKIKECSIFGIKSLIMITIYTTIEGFALFLISLGFHLPEFQLKFALSHIMDTLKLFYAHNPVSTFEFIICSIIATYIVAFFMEISLARLADGGSLLGAFNLVSIKRCIDIIGWRHYTLDYTKIILSITILAYLQYGIDHFKLMNGVVDLTIGLLIFVIEFIGIGKVYQDYKIKKELKRPVDVEIE